MYNLRIDTPYNTIYLLVDDVMDEDVQEIIHQPWVKQVFYRCTQEETVVDTRYKRLVRRKNDE